jgi:hypothetical protein
MSEGFYNCLNSKNITSMNIDLATLELSCEQNISGKDLMLLAKSCIDKIPLQSLNPLFGILFSKTLQGFVISLKYWDKGFLDILNWDLIQKNKDCVQILESFKENGKNYNPEIYKKIPWNIL